MRLLVPLLIAVNCRGTFCQFIDVRVTVQEIVNKWVRTFNERGISDAEGSAIHLMAYVLRVKEPTDVYRLKDQILTMFQEVEIADVCERRLESVPVQYITKVWYFRDLTLIMKGPVFIPRRETEDLPDIISLCLNLEDKNTNRKLNVLDVGCGSGAIALSLKRMVPQFNVTAIDIRTTACKLSRQNAVANNLTIAVEKGKVTVKGILRCKTADLSKYGMFDVIVSNPPYVKTMAMTYFPREIKIYEDLYGHDGGVDGLDIIKGLIKFATYNLRVNGSLFMQVDVGQPSRIAKWVEFNRNRTGMVLKRVFPDYKNYNRFLYFVKVKEVYYNNTMNNTLCNTMNNTIYNTMNYTAE